MPVHQASGQTSECRYFGDWRENVASLCAPCSFYRSEPTSEPRKKMLHFRVGIAFLVAIVFVNDVKGAPTEVTSPTSQTTSNFSLFSWPKDPSELFDKISALPREDVVAKIKAVVEPMTKDTLTQLTPDFLKSLVNRPKEEMVEYVSGVLPAPKSVVSQVHSILSPAGDLLSPAAKGLSDLLADLAGRTENSTEPEPYKPSSTIRAAASAASNRAIRLAVDATKSIMSIAFEPLIVAHLLLVIDDPQLKGQVRLDDLLVNNVSTFVLQSIESDPGKMTANFSATVEEFNVTGHYDMDCNVTHDGHRIFGKGSFTVIVRNLKVDGAVRLGIKDLFLHVRNLQLAVTMGDLKVQLQRLLGNDAISGIASGVISDVGPHFLEEFQEEVGSILSAQVAEHTNKLLSLFSIPVILEKLKVRGEDVLAARKSTTMQPIDFVDLTKDLRTDKVETDEEPATSISSGSKEEEPSQMWELEIRKHAIWLEEQARRTQKTRR